MCSLPLPSVQRAPVVACGEAGAVSSQVRQMWGAWSGGIAAIPVAPHAQGLRRALRALRARRVSLGTHTSAACSQRQGRAPLMTPRVGCIRSPLPSVQQAPAVACGEAGAVSLQVRQMWGAWSGGIVAIQVAQHAQGLQRIRRSLRARRVSLWTHTSAACSQQRRQASLVTLWAGWARRAQQSCARRALVVAR